MNRSQKIVTVVSALVVAGLVAIAAPAVTSVASEVGGWTLFHQPAAATAATTESVQSDVRDGYQQLGYGTLIPEPGPGHECASWSYVFLGGEGAKSVRAELLGADLVDNGPREFAVGEVGFDGQGRPATYTVAPGDAVYAIADRLCIYNGLSLALLNGYSHGAVIQPGDTLIVNADLVTDWVNPYAEE